MAENTALPAQLEHALPAELVHAVQALARTPALLVALDFDGTLAPFVDVPDEARALPEARAALERLAALPNTTVAYISGRPMRSLITVTDAADDTLLIGSHGVEERLGAGSPQLALDVSERSRLAGLHDQLTDIADRFPGARIEDKPSGFALHTRTMDPTSAEQARAEARSAALGAQRPFTVRGGKDVTEFSVRSDTKGDGVRRLRAHTGASAVLFAGDDVTDEDGFRALMPGDLGVKVGPGETAAQYRVAGPAQFAAVLALLAVTRSAVGES